MMATCEVNECDTEQTELTDFSLPHGTCTECE
jgi:hypothetical protein